MATDEIQKRLAEISTELFKMANACALEDNTGNAGIFLHEAVNSIWTAERCLNGEDIPIPMESIMRSMGIDMKKMMGVENIMHGRGKYED